ncbi:MAG: CopG family transcriptional regulator [Elusimicrobia bacterium]|nr:CopG family transcriptional regulator [Elusimicrobiota bacterium]
MPRTITLRLDDATYQMFHAFALADNRPLSNLIETAAKKHLEECFFADEAEMSAIRGDKQLLKKLKKGSRSAKARRGKFVG